MTARRTCEVALSAVTLSAALSVVGVSDAQAQGCVASRMEASTSPTNSAGMEYYLPKGKWQATFGYRNFFSHRHFVGDVEQDGTGGTPDRSKNPVENHVNLPELDVSYAFSDRLSASVNVPFGIMQRRNPPRAATATSPAIPAVYTDSKGLGDINVLGRFWVASPTHSSHQNLSIGLGVKLPTGDDAVSGDFVKVVNGTIQPWIHPVDQSIQLGDGGYGIITELQAFKTFGSVTAYVTGGYLFNPKVTNGVETGRGDPNEAIMSVADQFAARIGANVPLKFVKGLSVGLGGRLEGVPASDVIGGSEGFRRPGYSIGIEPSMSYAWGKNSFAFGFPYLVYRNRTQSYADELATEATGKYSQGDAAFADYVFIVGFSRRF